MGENWPSETADEREGGRKPVSSVGGSWPSETADERERGRQPVSSVGGSEGWPRERAVMRGREGDSQCSVQHKTADVRWGNSQS